MVRNIMVLQVASCELE